MNTIVPQLIEVLRSMWQGRWMGLALAWLTALAGCAVVFLMPDKYEATARVFVDTQSILKPLLHGLAVQPNVEQEVTILSRTLISRPNLQKLVRMTDMDLKVKTPEEREKLIDEVMRALYIKSVGHGNLYTIGFSYPHPSQALRVVQSLLSIFVESGLSAKSNDTGQAKRFIEEQIRIYEQKLREAEDQVKEFKLQNMDAIGPEGRDFFGTLSALAEHVRETRLLLAEAQNSRDTLKQQAADEAARPASPIAPPAIDPATMPTPELDARLSTLSKRLDELLLRYTDNHPDVTNTRRIMKEVEAQRAEERKRLSEELESRRTTTLAPGGVGNPVYPQLKLALAEAEAQVARLHARLADLERRHAELRDRARSIPEREAQFKQLNRDYAIQKQNYDMLVARRESALIAGHAEAATGVADFRIIDPPRVSPNPVAPNRKMLTCLVVLLSLCAGMAGSHLFSMLHPTFQDTRALKQVAQRPTLGAVALVASPTLVAKRRQSRLVFLGGVGGLATIWCAALAAVFVRGIFAF